MLRKALMRRSEGRRSRHEELVLNNFVFFLLTIRKMSKFRGFVQRFEGSMKEAINNKKCGGFCKDLITVCTTNWIQIGLPLQKCWLPVHLDNMQTSVCKG
jgi:hypothetical protein